jgi:hypothetical protein
MTCHSENWHENKEWPRIAEIRALMKFLYCISLRSQQESFTSSLGRKLEKFTIKFEIELLPGVLISVLIEQSPFLDHNISVTRTGFSLTQSKLPSFTVMNKDRELAVNCNRWFDISIEFVIFWTAIYDTEYTAGII